MGGIKMLRAVVVVTSLVMGIMGGGHVEAQVHHVVGGESGWHSSSDLASWAASRNFTVGDHLWFGYVTADDSVVELQTMEEYLSCNLANPIRMLTDGVDKISLEEEGVLYFASGNLENCKNGLKLQLNVVDQSNTAVATGPMPSFSPHCNGVPYILFIGLLLFSMGF